jgi:hypothetical protein
MNIQYYELKLFNWNFLGGGDKRGKHCLSIIVPDDDTVHNQYIDKNLNLNNVAINCWYTPKEIAEILHKLNDCILCSHCGKRVNRNSNL